MILYVNGVAIVLDHVQSWAWDHGGPRSVLEVQAGTLVQVFDGAEATWLEQRLVRALGPVRPFPSTEE